MDIERRMKVGILTLPLSDNYGGMLQAAALYRVLGDMGHEPVLLAKKFWRRFPISCSVDCCVPCPVTITRRPVLWRRPVRVIIRS